MFFSVYILLLQNAFFDFSILGGVGNQAGYKFVLCNYAGGSKSMSSNGYHSKRIAGSNLSIQYQTNIIFNNIPYDRISHTAFWIALFHPILNLNTNYNYDTKDQGNILYERLLPFLNRNPLEDSIAKSQKQSSSWITVPRNASDSKHIWLVWSTLRAALNGCGTQGSKLNGKVVDEFCLRMRW